METLRLITCGSVADGKSTLIEHLLLESKAVFDNQLCSPECESGQYGNRAEKSDLALLADSWQVEFEQGITTDLSYRVFATDRRRYIVVDTPGQEHYTRNVATVASAADLAVIVVERLQGGACPDTPPQSDCGHDGDSPCGAGSQQDGFGRFR